MTMEIGRDSLVKPLNLLGGIIPKSGDKPIKQHIAIFGNVGDKVVFKGTDNEIEVAMVVDCQISEKIFTTVSAKKFNDICKSLGEGSNIQMSRKDSKILIKSGKSKFNLQSLPIEDYTGMSVVDDKNVLSKVVLTQSELKWHLEQVEYAMSVNDVRSYLNGVLFEVKNGLLTLVATNGHRLNCTQIKVEANDADDCSVVVSRKTVKELIKVLEDNANQIIVSICKDRVVFKFGRTEIMSLGIAGKFPDYSRVLPKQNPIKCNVNRKMILEALGRVSIVNEGTKFNHVTMKLTHDNIELLCVNTVSKEESNEDLSISYDDVNVTVSFNGNYLTDTISSIESENVRFSFLDGNSSCLIEYGFNDKNIGDTFKSVIMPMKL